MSSLGIGAIIGTGIFVLTGLAARNYAGPGLIVSFIFAGIACAFAALCYAEFASMAPVAGSAYTYAYVSLGELVAWIIGWDLVLEYAMASATVAVGWSSYFMKFLGLFKTPAGQALISIPLWLTMDPFTASTQHTDYLTSGTLVVESAVAVPLNAEGERIALPAAPQSEIHRVESVDVTFTRESIDKIQRLWGGNAAASIETDRTRVGNQPSVRSPKWPRPRSLKNSTTTSTAATRPTNRRRWCSAGFTLRSI